MYQINGIMVIKSHREKQRSIDRQIKREREGERERESEKRERDVDNII